MPTAGNTIRTPYLYLDSADAPLGGMTSPTDITFTLFRETTGGMVAASETVSFAATATTGYYTISFTPQNTGLYTLFCKELNVGSGLRQPRFDFSVLAAGSILVPSYSNAFCSEQDIERWINAPIDATKSPSDTEAAAWAEMRASVLMILCSRLGYPVTPGSSTLTGTALEDMLREANAIGAALDYLTAQTRNLAPFDAGRGRLSFFEDRWNTYAGYVTGTGTPIPGFIELEIRGNLVSLSTDHILSGDTIAADSSVAPTDVGIQATMGDVF